MLYYEFFVVEELATFFFYRNVVNYNVDKINDVQFGEEKVSRFDVVQLGSRTRRIGCILCLSQCYKL
jgi:hypothetical protein